MKSLSLIFPLPQRPDVSQVEFTAYAFNDDHKKGATSAPVIYQLSPQRRPMKRRAYIITVGVDATSDPRLRLLFAPNGARDIEQLLTEKFKSQYEVVPISLVSDYKEKSTDLKRFMATKANIRAVLGICPGMRRRMGKRTRYLTRRSCEKQHRTISWSFTSPVMAMPIPQDISTSYLPT